MAQAVRAKRHEYVGVIVVVVALLLLLCLITYDPSDASLNSLYHKEGLMNRIGPFGAYAADLLFQTSGFAAYLLIPPLVLLGFKLMFGVETADGIPRILGILLLIAASSAALQLSPLGSRALPFRPGGFAGVLIADALISFLGSTGAWVVVLGGLVLALLSCTSLSFERAYKRLQGDQETEKLSLRERFRRWKESHKSVRAVVNIKPSGAAAAESPAKPAPPRAATPVAVEPRIQTPRAVEPEAPRQPVAAAERPRHPMQRKFVLPSFDLLSAPEGRLNVDEAELMDRARQLAEKCAEFDVHGSITHIHPGPVVTTFEFKPDAGIKYSRITSLVDDLCLGIKAESIRIDRIPGKATVGIEVPNPQREIIMLREVLEADVFRKSTSRLTLALGKLINGSVYVTDLGRMPHLLIAGATGSGKSVALNCMITSILFKAAPEEVRFIFIDPKRLELGVYADIPYLLTPIVTDPKEAANALRWATSEMESRYRKLALRGVRNIDQYNALLRSTGRQLSLLESNDDEGGELDKPLPYLVIVIDELADLMVVSSREVEECISRLAAMARAVGIHLILATQRPSVDVITGIIKANFPCRIAFKVASKVDSRTIIDANGAEQLLGCGDMLFIPPGSSRLTRIHGAYVSEKETQAIVEHLRRQARPAYDESVLSYGEGETDEEGNLIEGDAHDSLYSDAVRIVVSEGRASTSLLQRRLSIGYGRAAKLIDMMYGNGIVGPADGSKPREILVGIDFLDRLQ
ncbi:MAG: DNA translocase FtsK 4TM domain-containing protein [Acidobacteria bacterium]|nr:DNA translocase FtsK 4TM domain-containing protein [Acidobacteriota bacterium]